MNCTSVVTSKNQTLNRGDSASRLAVHTLAACWLGMVFDGMDTNNYILTLHPALKEILCTSSDAVIGSYGAGTLAIFMTGWAIGAFLFGLLADHIGRARTLVYTVLLYAVCTGACAFVHHWHEFALLRFLVGCGIGGEISIGGVILAELWSSRSRLHATAFLQTGFPCGLLMLGAINLLIGHLGWRWLYIVGMLPAVLAIYMRVKLEDPDQFKLLRAQRKLLIAKPKSELTAVEKNMLRSPLSELFQLRNLGETAIVAGLASCVCIGAYAVLSWVPPWINQITGTLAVSERSYAAVSQSLGSIVGCACAGLVVMRIGRRWAFRMAFLAAFAVCSAMFLTTKSFGFSLLVWSFLSGFFVFASFAYLFIYVPELYDTKLRATAFAFCIQSGRLFSAGACLTAGYLVGHVFHGSYALAGASMATVYLLGFAGTFFMPQSKGKL